MLSGNLTLITSVALLDELEDVLARKLGPKREAARHTRVELERIAEVTSPALVQALSRDSDDDVVLATAVAAKADVLVTGDQDLLVLQQCGGIPILTPRDLAERLNS